MVNQELKIRSRIAACGLLALVFFYGCAHKRGMAGGPLRHDGLEREFILYQPPPAQAHSGLRPLLLVLHGGGGTHRGMIRLTNGRFHTLADRDGFFVVYPQGIDKSWNDGRRGKVSGAHRKGIDDAGFLRALIEDLIAQYPVDPEHIFATGISNGGLMSFKLGCSLPGTIRAIATFAALNQLSAWQYSTAPKIRWCPFTAVKSTVFEKIGARCCQLIRPSSSGEKETAADRKRW